MGIFTTHSDVRLRCIIRGTPTLLQAIVESFSPRQRFIPPRTRPLAIPLRRRRRGWCTDCSSCSRFSPSICCSCSRSLAILTASWQDAVPTHLICGRLDVLIESSCRHSTRLAPSYRRTSSSHFSSPAGRYCSLHRSGTKICRSALSSTHSIPTTDQTSESLQT